LVRGDLEAIVIEGNMHPGWWFFNVCNSRIPGEIVGMRPEIGCYLMSESFKTWCSFPILALAK